MRSIIFLFSILFHLSLSAQTNENTIIPYLCDTDKYGIADLESGNHSECIFDNLSSSNLGVTLGELNGDMVFVKKDGSYSSVIPDLTYTGKRLVTLYRELNSDHRYFCFSEDDTIYIYDVEYDKCHGPLLKPDIIENKRYLRAPISRGFRNESHDFVFFTQGVNQIVLSKTGATINLPNNSPFSYHISGGYLYYIGGAGEPSIIYDNNLEEQLVADTIVFGNFSQRYTFAQKNGKSYKVENKISNDSIDNEHIEELIIKEVSSSLKWESYGYTYHESESNRWIEDNNGDIFYSLKTGERVSPLMDNILLYHDGIKQFLLGDETSKLRQPHLSITRFGERRNFLFQDSLGFYILNDSSEIDTRYEFKKAYRVNNDLLWVEYQNGQKALLDKDLEVVFETEENVVRGHNGNMYVYQSDTLYGLLDSLGSRITPPLSTRENFYASSDLDWVKIHQNEKSYLYNIRTKARTEGLSNEFRFSDRYKDEKGSSLISSYTYGVDSSYFYRKDGSIFEVLHKSRSKYFQDERYRYESKEISKKNHVYVDNMYSDTLLQCIGCDDIDIIDLGYDNTVDFLICDYRNNRKELFDTRGMRLLPMGMSLVRNASVNNELKYFPRVIVLQNGRVGVYDIEEKEIIIPIKYASIHRQGGNKLSLRYKGKNQITDLNGKPINTEFYFKTYGIGNGDIRAQYEMEGVHKKRVYSDEDDPNMDPCEGKIVDAPNYYYKILDNEGKSRFSKKYLKYDYRSDDIINVEEWTGKDTIYYCMNIKGRKRKTTSKGVTFKPFHKTIIERKEGKDYMFFDKKLRPKTNRKFNEIQHFETENERLFYMGVDSLFTYVYNEKFKETIKLKGNYRVSRHGKLRYLYQGGTNALIILLDADGKQITKEPLIMQSGYSQNGIIKYKKGNKNVYFDMVNGRKFWD